MIYYVHSDGHIVGAVYGETEADLQGITKVPDGCTAMFFDDAAHADMKANQGEYTIQNGVPVFTPIPDNVKLANAQQAKIVELEQAYENAVQTFQSSALGAPHTYLAGEKDMILLGNEYSFLTGPDYDNSLILWYTKEANYQNHTALQFRQLWRDGRAWVRSQNAHKQTVEAQINAATTVDAASAITW